MSDIEQATILITNSVRVFSPGTTMARSAKPFISAEIAAVKANLLYAEQLQVNSYLMDILAMGRHDLTRSRMPLRAFMMVCSFLRNSPDETSKSTESQSRPRSSNCSKKTSAYETLHRRKI